MLNSIELYKWTILEQLVLTTTGDHENMLKIMDVFKRHDIVVDEAIAIIQDIAAVTNRENKAEIVSFTDILKAKEKK